MKVLVVIEVSEPLFVDTRLRKTYELPILRAGHPDTSLQNKSPISSPLVQGNTGISASTHSYGLSVPRLVA